MGDVIDIGTKVSPPKKIRVKDPLKLAIARETFRETGENLSETARRTGIKYQTLRYWKKQGYLDLQSVEAQIELMRAIGPETMAEIAQRGYGLAIEAQKLMGAKLEKASAKDLSKIASEQSQVANLASGQATQRVDFLDRAEMARVLREAGVA